MFRLTEDGKKSYLSLKETFKKYDEIEALILTQTNLLAQANTNFVKEYIQNNINILKMVKKNFEDQWSKDPEYQIIVKSDQNLKSFYNLDIVYVEENEDQDKDYNFYD